MSYLSEILANIQGGKLLKHIKISDSFTAQKPSYNRFAKIQTEIATSQDRDIQINIDINNRFGYTFVFLFSTLPYVAKKYNKNLINFDFIKKCMH